VEWDDPAVDWAGFDLAVIRSTWDYTWRAAEFTAWAERCGAATRLANPADVVRWNTDKRYLGDLAAAGVPVVPTRYLAPGDPPTLPDGYEYVVKPASGAGARLAARYTPDEHDRAPGHPRRMPADGYPALGQPDVTALDPGRGAPAADARRRVHRDGAALRHRDRPGRRAGAGVRRRAPAARLPQGRGPRPGHPLRRPEDRAPQARSLDAGRGRGRRRRAGAGRRAGRAGAALR